MPTLVQRPSTGPTTANADTRRAARRRKTIFAALALIVAVLLHALVIVLLAWALPHWPRPPLRKGSAPIQLTVLPAEPSDTPGLHKTEAVPQQPEYMRTNSDQKADTPPPDPKFISDQDTHDAAEKPPDDPFKPLPTQDGKQIAAFDFTTNPYRAGKEAVDAASVAAPAAQPVPTPPTDQPKPTAKESPTPTPNTAKPTPGDFPTLQAAASPSDTPPQPTTTPTPRVSSTPPVEDALARQAATVARQNHSVNSTGVQQPPGFQPETTQTKMSGSVSNRGKASPAAIATPLGKYEKAVSDAIAARWYQLISDHMSELVHTEDVQIHFYVARSGKIVGVRASGSKKNTVLASVSIEAITESELPPIPDNVAELLPEGQLEVDYSFGLFER